jgi:hypothetical protein
LGDIYLRCAQGVIAQDFVWLAIVHQNENRGNTPGALLSGVFTQKLVKQGLTAVKPIPIMDLRVKKLFLKHA